MNGFRNHAEEIEHHTQLSRAFNEGKAVGMAHETTDTTGCPYRTESDMGKEWFAGYKEGRKCRSN
jgi:ribosome modulation factor